MSGTVSPSNLGATSNCNVGNSTIKITGLIADTLSNTSDTSPCEESEIPNPNPKPSAVPSTTQDHAGSSLPLKFPLKAIMQLVRRIFSYVIRGIIFLKRSFSQFILAPVCFQIARGIRILSRFLRLLLNKLFSFFPSEIPQWIPSTLTVWIRRFTRTPTFIFYRYMFLQDPLLFFQTLGVNYILPIVIEFAPFLLNQRMLSKFLRESRDRIQGAITGAPLVSPGSLPHGLTQQPTPMSSSFSFSEHGGLIMPTVQSKQSSLISAPVLASYPTLHTYGAYLGYSIILCLLQTLHMTLQVRVQSRVGNLARRFFLEKVLFSELGSLEQAYAAHYHMISSPQPESVKQRGANGVEFEVLQSNDENLTYHPSLIESSVNLAEVQHLIIRDIDDSFEMVGYTLPAFFRTIFALSLALRDLFNLLLPSSPSSSSSSTVLIAFTAGFVRPLILGLISEATHSALRITVEEPSILAAAAARRSLLQVEDFALQGTADVQLHNAQDRVLEMAAALNAETDRALNGISPAGIFARCTRAIQGRGILDFMSDMALSQYAISQGISLDALRSVGTEAAHTIGLGRRAFSLFTRLMEVFLAQQRLGHVLSVPSFEMEQVRKYESHDNQKQNIKTDTQVNHVTEIENSMNMANEFYNDDEKIDFVVADSPRIGLICEIQVRQVIYSYAGALLSPAALRATALKAIRARANKITRKDVLENDTKSQESGCGEDIKGMEEKTYSNLNHGSASHHLAPLAPYNPLSALPLYVFYCYARRWSYHFIDRLSKTHIQGIENEQKSQSTYTQVRNVPFALLHLHTSDFTSCFKPQVARFERGHSYLLIGRNQSGKSTLLKLISRLLSPNDISFVHDSVRECYVDYESNSVALNSSDALDISSPLVDIRITHLPFSTKLVETSSVGENLLYASSSQTLPLYRFSRWELRSHLTYILQHPFLFDGSIYDNIVHVLPQRKLNSCENISDVFNETISCVYSNEYINYAAYMAGILESSEEDEEEKRKKYTLSLGMVDDTYFQTSEEDQMEEKQNTASRDKLNTILDFQSLASFFPSQWLSQGFTGIFQGSVTSEASYPLHPILLQRVYNNGANISGGFAQSIAVARAFLRPQAQVLLLDESLSQMDPLKTSRVLRNILTFAKAREMIVLLVSHHIPPILPFIDKVVMMEKGNIVALDEPRILANHSDETVRRLYLNFATN